MRPARSRQRGHRIGAVLLRLLTAAFCTSRHFAAKQQFGRYRGSSGHARRRFHIPSRNGVIVHRRPRRSKMALTRSVRPAEQDAAIRTARNAQMRIEEHIGANE